jgi:predicted dehydrogenase
MGVVTGIALVGAGHLGTFHARALQRLAPGEPRWVVDIDPGRARALAAEVGGRAHARLAEIRPAPAAVVVATPTETHHALAAEALRAGCHVLVEKPMTATLEEGEQLVALAARQGRLLQVGHVERFNPIVRAARGRMGTAAFVEAQRLAPFVPRSLDVDVVLDLMIHDLDILLSLVRAPLESLDAVGVAVLTAREDIASARLRFADGAVANLTASRVSREKVRKLRIFGSRGYLSLDLLRREGLHVEIRPAADGPIEVPGVGSFAVIEERLAPAAGDALDEQMRAFLQAIAGQGPVAVDGATGLAVLRLARRVQHDVRASLERLRPGAVPPGAPPQERA